MRRFRSFRLAVAGRVLTSISVCFAAWHAGGLAAANGALEFNGAQSVAIPYGPALDFVQQVTVEGWIKCTDLSSYNPLLRKNINFLQDNYDLRLNGPCRLEFICKIDGRVILFGAEHCFEANRWYHIAGTFDGEYLRAYVDGVVVGVLRQPGQLAMDPVVTYIGHGDGDYFRGRIDEVRLWKVARTAEELQVSRSGGVAPNADGLVGYWTFDEDDGQIVRDLKGNNLDGTLGETGSPGPDDPLRVPSDAPISNLPPFVLFEATLVPKDLRSVALVLTANWAFRGGEVGISYDPALVVPDDVRPGPGFPGSGKIFSQTDPPKNCSAELGVAAGITVGWLNSSSGEASLPAGKYELLTVFFKRAPGARPGTCSPLRFVTCLGVPTAPVRNVVTDAKGVSVAIVARDGQVCVKPESPFRRGDSNGDGFYDITDAIVIGGCLFLGDECAPCRDSMDTNDDGALDVTDMIYLLGWRFLGGVEPPFPFPGCGRDPTLDTLGDCELFPICP